MLSNGFKASFNRPQPKPKDKGLQVAILGGLFLWKINGVQDSSVQRAILTVNPDTGVQTGGEWKFWRGGSALYPQMLPVP